MKKLLLILIFVYILIMGILLAFGVMGSCHNQENEKVTLPEQGSKTTDSPAIPILSVDNSGRVAFDYAVNIESHGDRYAYNEFEDAKGIVQIRPIMVRDVNRIIKVRHIAGVKPYVHDDAYDPIKSREMFDLFQWYYCPDGTVEEQHRKWNEGP